MVKPVRGTQMASTTYQGPRPIDEAIEKNLHLFYGFYVFSKMNPFTGSNQCLLPFGHISNMFNSAELFNIFILLCEKSFHEAHVEEHSGEKKACTED